jgi:sugar phosphate isomerase/epimerase
MKFGTSLSRRSLLVPAAAFSCRRAPGGFRLAMCNEAFEKRSFAETCRAIRKAGYAGIEIAPFTLSEDPVAIPAGQRREYARTMRSEGLAFAGLHWLLVAPKGLHVTAPDQALRQRSWRHMSGLIDLCADLGRGGVMVLGSPQQRAVAPGLSRAEAVKHFEDGLAGIAPRAVERGVQVLIESFTQRPEDVVTSLEQAVAIVRRIGSPGIQTMFDTNNASREAEPHAVLVDRYFDWIRHVHLNEGGGPYPGAGTYDYQPVLRVLRRRNYAGWLSLEVLDFRAGADKIAQDSLRFIQAEIANIDDASRGDRD